MKTALHLSPLAQAARVRRGFTRGGQGYSLSRPTVKKPSGSQFQELAGVTPATDRSAYHNESSRSLDVAYDANGNGLFADAGEIATVDPGGADGTAPLVGFNTSIVFDPLGRIAISYAESTNLDLKYTLRVPELGRVITSVEHSRTWKRRWRADLARLRP